MRKKNKELGTHKLGTLGAPSIKLIEKKSKRMFRNLLRVYLGLLNAV